MASEPGNAQEKGQASAAKTTPKKVVKKPFMLESPFADPTWPAISPEHSDAIMELLCRLIEPIGMHRVTWVNPSKGKRSRKRKRREEAAASGDNFRFSETEPYSQPSPPEILQHVVVGFNGVVRCLDPTARQFIDKATTNTDQRKLAKLAAVFVDRSSAPEILWSQLPFLVKAAELKDASHQARIVPLPRGAAVRLGEILRIPRAQIVAVGEDAPDAASLLSFVRNNVPLMDIPWLKSMDSSEFQPTKVGPHVGPKVHEEGSP